MITINKGTLTLTAYKEDNGHCYFVTNHDMHPAIQRIKQHNGSRPGKLLFQVEVDYDGNPEDPETRPAIQEAFEKAKGQARKVNKFPKYTIQGL